MKKRTGHFMPVELLDSQFETLEEPHDAITVSVDKSPQEITEEIICNIKRIPGI
jgi:gluconokinase